jgi:hypothetical protein
LRVCVLALVCAVCCVLCAVCCVYVVVVVVCCVVLCAINCCVLCRFAVCVVRGHGYWVYVLCCVLCCVVLCCVLCARGSWCVVRSCVDVWCGVWYVAWCCVLWVRCGQECWENLAQGPRSQETCSNLARLLTNSELARNWENKTCVWCALLLIVCLRVQVHDDCAIAVL